MGIRSFAGRIDPLEFNRLFRRGCRAIRIKRNWHFFCGFQLCQFLFGEGKLALHFGGQFISSYHNKAPFQIRSLIGLKLTLLRQFLFRSLQL